MGSVTREDALGIIALIPARYRHRVQAVEDLELDAAGDLLVYRGERPEKPVILDAETKRYVKGSGRRHGANDIGAISRATAIKRSASYREAFEKTIAPLRADNPEAAFSLERLIEVAFSAAEGFPQEVDCGHPEAHTRAAERKHVVAFKPDMNIVFRMIELLVGKAKETIDANINITTKRLEYLMTVRDTPQAVYYVTEAEQRERYETMVREGIIEPDWVDLPVTQADDIDPLGR